MPGFQPIFSFFESPCISKISHQQHKGELFLYLQVATLVTAFMTKLRSSMTDETFLKQLFQIGILLEFESLLSCGGDELGMLEDFIIGVQDLKTVAFRIDQAVSPDDIMPTFSGTRWVLRLNNNDCDLI